MKTKKLFKIFSLILVIALLFCACAENATNSSQKSENRDYIASVNEVPEFNSQPFVAIKNNIPDFTGDEITNISFERYAELDNLGRCGAAVASIGRDIMPSEDRGSIGAVKPSGWHTVKYDNVNGKYLYNRCHLIGYQLTGENANVGNLITGTRYMNVEGMLPFENMVADYVKESGNHVMYRVKPVFDGNNLVARGVQIEALSVEDKGEGICFNVYVYNNQPGIMINYINGDSKLDDGIPFLNENASSAEEYILNTNTKKFHLPSCESAKKTSPKNKKTYIGNKNELLNDGYSPCKACQ